MAALKLTATMTNKTQPTKASAAQFLNAIEDPDRRREAKVLHKLMREVTGARAQMWGPSIVGYGKYHYRYESGREGDFFLTGFSPRKKEFVVYVMAGFKGNTALLKRLGKHRVGKSCLYLKSLEGVDLDALRKLTEDSVKAIQKKYPD